MKTLHHPSHHAYHGDPDQVCDSDPIFELDPDPIPELAAFGPLPFARHRQSNLEEERYERSPSFSLMDGRQCCRRPGRLC